MLLFAGVFYIVSSLVAPFSCAVINIFFLFICSQLKDDCLSATTTSCPLIESLILMSCPSIGSDGLYSLQSLSNLTMLDLSYTFLTNLQPVFESCSQLKVRFYFFVFRYMHDSTTDMWSFITLCTNGYRPAPSRGFLLFYSSHIMFLCYFILI